MRGDSDRHELFGGIFGEAAGFGSSGVTAIPASGASSAAAEVFTAVMEASSVATGRLRQ